MTTTTTHEILDALVDDRDTVDVGGGLTLRLRIQPDDCDPIESFGDGYVYGKAEWVRRRETYASGSVEFYFPRPDDMDGNAEILRRGRDAALWWQPFRDGGGPADRRGTPEFAAYRENVLDIVEYGFSQIGVEVLHGEDAYGHPIVTACAWLGGIEPNPDREYARAVVTDLLSELDIASAFV